MELDALALEYQRYYGSARRDLNVADLVNNPTANGKCRVFGLRSLEQPTDLRLGELGSLLEYTTNPTLIARHCYKIT